MVSFENFVKSMPPNLWELKVTPSFCFAFKIPDDVTATNLYGKPPPAFPTGILKEFCCRQAFQTSILAFKSVDDRIAVKRRCEQISYKILIR